MCLWLNVQKSFPMSTINITVSFLTKGSFALTVDPQSTVTDLKKQLELLLGIPIDQQKIILAGMVLLDEQTLADAKVVDGGVVCGVRNNNAPKAPTPDKFDISIKTITGEEWIQTVEGAWTVEEAKKVLSEHLNWQPCSSRIIYGGKQLEDGNTLAFYGLQPKDQIHLLGSLSGD